MATQSATRLLSRVAPKVVLPKHVQHCWHMNKQTPWFIYTWDKRNPLLVTRRPYTCGSWRCPGCARHEAAVTFARIRDACAPFDASDFVFFVLTLDRNGYFSGMPWRDADEAYKELGHMSELFLKRLRRWMERESMKPLGSEWVAVAEAHGSGWPHMNLLAHSPELAHFLAAQRTELELAGLSARECVLLRGDLLDIATATRWGPQSTAEPVRDKGAVAGYITKLAGLVGATGAEIAKITQAPLSAPARFRRLRSGKGFLPPRERGNENITGTLVRRTRDVDGTPLALPLHDVPDEHRELVAKCCCVEEGIIVQELQAEHWNRAAQAVWPEAVFTLPVVSRWKP